MIALAPIVITASALTIILQIVLIILVLDTKKKPKFDLKEKPLSAAAPEIRDARKPREHENRFNNRRPSFDQRAKPSSASSTAAPIQNVDPVERSLRDINLRLKNAERDQEKERRRIKDTIAPPPHKRNDLNKPRERNEGFRRNDRPRQDFVQQRSAEPPKPVREERPSLPLVEPRENKPTPSAVAIPPQPEVFPLPTPGPVQPIVKQADPVFELDISSSIDKENFQHGRKIMVKRRMLKAEDEQTEEPVKEIDKPLGAPSMPEVLSQKAPSTDTPEPKSLEGTKPAKESNDSREMSSDEPIGFGR
jgi:hypothetical protein